MSLSSVVFVLELRLITHLFLYIQSYVSEVQVSGNYLRPSPFLCQTQTGRYTPHASKICAIYLQSTLRMDWALWMYFPLHTIHTPCEQTLRSETSVWWGLKTLTMTQENIWVTGLLQAKGKRGNFRNEKCKSQLLLSLFSSEIWQQAGIRTVSDLNAELYWTRKIFPHFPTEVFFRSFIIVKLNVETLAISFM